MSLFTCPVNSTFYPAAPSFTARNRVGRALRRAADHTCRAQSSEAPLTETSSISSVLADRRLLVAGTLLAPLLSSLPCRAEGSSTYRDPTNKYEIKIPEGWLSGSGQAPGSSRSTRQALAWFPEGNADTNISVIVTNIGADFTSLGSFGDAQAFGENLVSSMDRSFLLRTPKWTHPKEGIQQAALINTKGLGTKYFVEYTVTKPSQAQRHLLSLVALGNNGTHNKLYTATAQCREEQLTTWRPVLQTVLESFKPPHQDK